MFQNVVPYRCSSDSDEEPVTKQPRLSRRHSRGSGRESPGQSARSTRSDRSNRSKRHKATRSRYYEDSAASKADLSDTDASSENRSIGDGSYFEVRILDPKAPVIHDYFSFNQKYDFQVTLDRRGNKKNLCRGRFFFFVIK